ncbi:MAG: copper-binding protein [Pseudolabrys sp.]|nr:copper-binding protein [Pseudolabrys sp.]
MRKMTSMLLLGALALSTATLSAPAYAQSTMTDGTVRKVDAATNKITIKHGPMKKFGMDDGMTMVYAVKDPALMTGVKTGDKIKFDADNVNGQFIVTKIAPAQ